MKTKQVILPRPAFINTEPVYEVEIKKPSSSAIASAGDDFDNGNAPAAMLTILNDCNISIGDIKNPSRGDVKKLPVVSAEYLIEESFMMFDGMDHKLEAVFGCPTTGCNGRVIYREDPNGNYDSRYSLSDLEVITDLKSGEYISYTHNLLEETSGLWKGEKVLEVSTMHFRDILLGDQIEVAADQSLQSTVARSNKLLLKALVDIDGDILDREAVPEDFEKQKNRFGYQILDFPDFRDLPAINKGLRKYRRQKSPVHSCPMCGKKWRQPFDTLSFFFNALSTDSQI
jgi:hypothetical protein